MRLELIVSEVLRQDDIGKNMVKIDPLIFEREGLKVGSYVSVQGSKFTHARIYPSTQIDVGAGVARMDKYIRMNCGVTTGDRVFIEPVEFTKAKKVIVVPQEGAILADEVSTWIKHRLLNRALTKGDFVSISGFIGSLHLKVMSVQPDGWGVVCSDTRIILKEFMEEPEHVLTPITYEDIGGLGGVIGRIREMIELPLKHPELFKRLGIKPPKGVLLYGPPGTGKTLIARAVANESGAHFISINGPEIMSKYYGESEKNLRSVFEEASKNAPAIIFIDEIDSIAPRRENVSRDVERRVVATLLSLMDGLEPRGDVIVIGATNMPEILDPALRRPGRFDREIELPTPNFEGRKEILKIHTRNVPLDEDVDLDKIAEVTVGFVGADLEALVREAAMIRLHKVAPNIEEEGKIPESILENLKVSMSDFIGALKIVQPSALREISCEISKVMWKDIGGLNEAKRLLREAVELPFKRPDVFKRLGIKPAKGVLLYGPPGCGKTLLARAAAGESMANFISIKGPEILSKWVGESEKAIRRIFKKARQVAPAIIFIDEIDSITPRRGIFDNSGVVERVLSQLLTEIDGIHSLTGVVVVGATNRPDIVDPALLRPGRLDLLIYVPPPDYQDRISILEIHTRKMPLSRDVDFRKIAELTDGYSGADLEALVREAAMNAIRRNINSEMVKMEDFMLALKRIKPSLTSDIIEYYANIERQMKSYISDDKTSYFT